MYKAEKLAQGSLLKIVFIGESRVLMPLIGDQQMHGTEAAREKLRGYKSGYYVTTKQDL